jgi:hypothetical protein
LVNAILFLGETRDILSDVFLRIPLRKIDILKIIKLDTIKLIAAYGMNIKSMLANGQYNEYFVVCYKKVKKGF